MNFDPNYATIAVVALVVAGSVGSSWMQQRDFMDIRSAMADHQDDDRRTLASLHTLINQGHAELQHQLGTKVDQETRKAMLSDLEHRLDRIERHLEMNDTRIDVLMEERQARVSMLRRDSLNKPASYIHRESYDGMDGTNLSGHGSASAIAYSRKIRDRLRPVILGGAL